MGNGRSRSTYSINKTLVAGSIYDPSDTVEEARKMPYPDEIYKIYSAHKFDSRKMEGDKSFAFYSSSFINSMEDADIAYGTVWQVNTVLQNPRTLNIDFSNDNREKIFNLAVNAEIVKKITKEYSKQLGHKLLHGIKFVEEINVGMGTAGALCAEVAGENYIILSKLTLENSVKNFVGNGNFNAVPVQSIGMVTHELGHAIQNNLSLKSDVYEQRITNFFSKTQDLGTVSIYATASNEEKFAETFSLYASGVEKTNLGNESYQHFKKLMKDVKLESMFGIVKNVSKDIVKKHTAKSNKTSTSKSFLPKVHSSGDRILVVKGDTIRSFTATPARKKRGFFTVTIDGKKYKVDVSTKQIIEMG